MARDIENRLLVLISERSEVPVDDLTPETALEDLGFDSLVQVELASQLSQEFDTFAVDDELEFAETVGDLLTAVRSVTP
ncbi:acyl carrier protein [Salinactinospora qingdaonensis]|uniref:Carrier domain-containing protein n=1 Tax=Salinactinospora qingdaonensis TaxID=702744 RepID=A0ABP7FF23_9ACTN